jgi:hypothetical protein
MASLLTVFLGRRVFLRLCQKYRCIKAWFR